MLRFVTPFPIRLLVLGIAAWLCVPASGRARPVNYILDNGVIQIGVDVFGTLGAEGGTPTGPPEVLTATSEGGEGAKSIGPGPSTTLVGLRDMATNFEAVTYGEPYEGWGVADLLSVQGGGATTSATEILLAGPAQSGVERPGSFGPTPSLFHVYSELFGVGTVKESDGSRLLTINDLVEVGGDAVPGLLVGLPLLRVTQDFRPSANPRAYEIEVTLENLSPGVVQPRFRRTVDWDIDPVPFDEYVTMRHGPSTAVVASVGNGFNDPNPLVPLDPSGKGPTCPENVDFTDCGPGDLGAAIDFEFPEMLPGQQFRFWLYYGAAPTEAGALTILDGLQASGYSLGQTATGGTPMTFFLGWKMPWAIIDNGQIQLGIGPYGELNVPGGTESAGGSGAPPIPKLGPLPGVTTVGLRNVGLNWEGLGGGTPVEGWGLASYGLKSHGGVRSSLFPDGGSPPPPKLESLGDGGNGAFNIRQVSFEVGGTGTLTESSGDRVRVVSEIGSPPFARVTHEFRPWELDTTLYLVKVKIEPVEAPPLLGAISSLGGPDLVYRRLMDWDAEDTPFAELVTIAYPKLSNVIASEGDAFQSPMPGFGLLPGGCGTDVPFTDCGPGDLGAAIDFNFPPLVEGQVEQFRLFYGAGAGSESGALSALAAAGVEVYSLGQTSEGIEILTGDPLGEGPAMTYVFGFRDVLFEDDFESADTSAWSSTVVPKI